MDTISVYKAQNELMALTVKDMLDENKVACMIRTNVIAGIDWSLKAIWGEVLVFAADEDRALELIGGFQGTLGMLSEHVEDPEGLDEDA